MQELLANKYFIWGGFNILVLAMLALDLGIFHRKDHKISVKEGLVWSVIWVVVALIFNVVVYFWQGEAKALQFFTGYLIERSLSIDNIFVFLLIFTYFGVPDKFQYRGACDARTFYRYRCFAYRQVPLDHLYFWRLSCLYRN